MPRRFRGMTVNLSGTSVQRWIVLLVIGTAVLFILAGFLSTSRVALSFSPPALQKLVSGISSERLVHIIADELPPIHSSDQSREQLPVRTISGFLFELVTSINPQDPRTFLGRELPGFAAFDFDILVSADDVNYTHFPSESPPPSDTFFVQGSGDKSEAGGKTPGNATDNSPGDKGNAANTAPNGASQNSGSAAPAPKGDKRMVFIYHTHNRESWLTIPELQGIDNPNRAYHDKKNITLVGQRLASTLKEQGINVQVSAEDHMGKAIYSRSYASSLKTVKAALAQNQNIDYLFDIHRNSSPKKDSTIAIQGKNYARVYFVIGKANPHWEKNLAFAKRVHDQLNSQYPRLSKGIIGKSENQGNGEYNQTLSEQSVLIEVGGYENTVEECYRTADALAEVIASIYWADAKKA